MTSFLELVSEPAWINGSKPKIPNPSEIQETWSVRKVFWLADLQEQWLTPVSLSSSKWDGKMIKQRELSACFKMESGTTSRNISANSGALKIN